MIERTGSRHAAPGMLDNRAAIIFGGSGAVGRSVAQVMARKGARVCIGGRDPARLERAASEIGASGVRVGGRTLTADRIIVATGSRPLMPEIAGIDGVEFLESTGLPTLPRRPESIIVRGGG